MVYQVPTPACIPHYDLSYGEEWNPPEDIKPRTKREGQTSLQDGAVKIIRRRSAKKPVKVVVGRSLLNR